MHFKLFGIALIAFVVVVGCSDGRPKRVPVSGKVLIDGKPLEKGTVQFTPPEGRPANGQLRPDGTFTLTTYEQGDGVVPGTHVVSVHAMEELGGGRIRWNVPQKYENRATSELTQQIDGPTDSVVIQLTWGKEKGPIVQVVDSGGDP